MDTKDTNSSESPPSNAPPPSDNSTNTPPSDNSTNTPPSSSSPPQNESSPPPPKSSPPPSSPPPPNASSPPPPKASNPPPPPHPDNVPPPPKSQENSPSTPSEQPPGNSPPSPPSQEPPQSSPAPPPSKSSPPAPPSDVSENPPPVPPSDESKNTPPVPPSDALNSSPPPPSGSPPPGGQSTPNPLILSPPGHPEPPPPNGSDNVSASNERDIGTAGAVAIGLVLLGVMGMALFWVWRRKKKVSPIVHSDPQSEYALLKMRYSPANASSHNGYDSSSETPVMGKSRNFYSYDELSRATNDFSESNLLGEGGFGSVFKGLLPDGREVAVKQLKDGGGQGEREFRAEVETISRVHHRHLVSLVGYCISDEKRLLVYNYVPKNTLHFHLHGHDVPALDWPTRLKIAIGASRGIAYLHEDCHPRIVHRDIKSSNILLDNNFEAQVSDFGLARLFSDANTHVTTRVMGTFGYMAPEYASSGKLTEKSDVFSFGVVLLELITGRKPVDTSQPPGEESLVEWARPLLNHALEKEEFQQLVDPRLGENYVDREMFRVIEAAAACVRYSALKRPRMSQIQRALDDITVSDLSNGMKVGESTILSSAQDSAEMRIFRRMAFSSRDYSTEFFMQGAFQSEEQ